MVKINVKFIQHHVIEMHKYKDGNKNQLIHQINN